MLTHVTERLLPLGEGDNFNISGPASGREEDRRAQIWKSPHSRRVRKYRGPELGTSLDLLQERPEGQCVCMFVSTKVHCHRMPQASPIWRAEKGEALFRQTVCKPRKPKVCSTESKWRPHFLEKVPPLVLHQSIFMQMRNPNRKVLLDLNSIVLIDWLCMYDWSIQMQIRIQLCSSDWMEQVSAHWSKYSSRNSLTRVGSDGRDTVQEAWQLSLGLFPAYA